MGYYIPETLKQFNNWLLWDADKVPHSAKTLKPSLNNVKLWDSYDHALMVLNNTDFEGLGFVFTKECSLTFIDLDHCIDEEGNYSTLAEEMLNIFNDCYAEISQSETGIHIVCIGSVPYTVKKKEIEIYSHGRYMAFTGNAIKLNEPQEAQERLEGVFHRFADKKPTEATTQSHKGIYTKQDYQGILEIILNSRQGEKFNMLHNGEWQRVIASNGKPYPSQSEADLAYISIANYFTHGNDEMTIALFNNSRLSDRIKANRDDYIKRLIKDVKRTSSGSNTKGTTNRQNITDYKQIRKYKRRAF